MILNKFKPKLHIIIDNKRAQIIAAIIAIILLCLISRFVVISASLPATINNISLVFVFLVFLSCSKKSFKFILMPFVILSAIYFPIQSTYGEMNYFFLASLYNTDISESHELFIGLSKRSLLYSFLIILGILFYRILIVKFKINLWRNKLLIVASTLCALITTQAFKLPKDFYDSFVEFNKNYRFNGEADSWVINDFNKKYDTHVLIIGESARKDYHGAYGYPVNNTPFMNSAVGTIVDGLITPGHTTVKSLSLMLTDSDKEKKIPKYNRNIIELANKSGFNTSWISNQGFNGLHDSPISIIATKANYSFFTKKGTWNSRNINDNELIGEFKKHLSFEHSSNPKFIVIHLYGSHSNVCDRLHDFNNKYITVDKKQKEIGCYLSSIEKTDYFIKEINSILEDRRLEKNESYSMIYFSDHGLSAKVVDGATLMRHLDVKEQYQVPLLKISSDDSTRLLVNNYKSGFNMVDGLSNWLGISAEGLNKNYDMFSNGVDDDDYGHDEYISKLEENKFVDISQVLLSGNEERVKKFTGDKDRFIAHAGGGIDGQIYTNSLEALNLNYSKGFKLFELDILETSDGHLVAAHDWKNWAEKTDYVGEMPPKLHDFKKYKILKKYTPMDMQDINKWFLERRDAILITDKINNPKKVLEEFTDNSRIRMELFSLDAVDEAVGLGFNNSMPNLSIIKSIGEVDEMIDYLKRKNISYIVANRTMNKDLAKKISDSGIKIYAYILGDEFREEEVICNENIYFYGIYFDFYDNNKKINCNKLN